MRKFLWDYAVLIIFGILALLFVSFVGFILKIGYDYVPYTNASHQQYLTSQGCSRTGEFAGRSATAIYKCADGVSYTESELRYAGIQSRKENK